MKTDNLPYSTFKTFVVRAPLLPFTFLQQMLLDNSLLNDKFKKIANRHDIREALFIAAPEFSEELSKWINGNELKEKEEERILQTLYKYLSRMASRSTPFGLFAGCATGTIGNKTSVLLSNQHEYERHTRMDMLYLCNLSSALSKHPHVKNKLRYYPNTTIYELGEQLRYIEYRYNKDRRTHHLVQIKNSIYVAQVLKESKKGKTTIDIVKSLVNKGIPKGQAEEFIDRLIDNQILISELDPTVTGEEFFRRIIKVIKPIEGIDIYKKTLNFVDIKINKIDKLFGNETSKYHEIATGLKSLGIDFDIKYLFQTDMNLNAKESTVSQSLIKSLQEGLIVLNKLTSNYTETNIQKFTDKFSTRYETREISLLKALDAETGIGYLDNDQNSDGDISPLIADIALPLNNNSSTKISWNPIQKILLDKFLEANSNQSFEIEITDNDLKTIEAKWDDLPVTFSLLVRIIEGLSTQFPEGRILMESAGNSSATNLLGRFCHGNEEIHTWAKEIALQDQKFFPHAILAEIVHLPESRVGNVILRPCLRDYEIPFLTTPSVNPEHTITLDDLLISVRNGEIILRSKRLNKRVIPRMSNAHNYSVKALPIYQFLCDLQNQNLRATIGFNWGNISNSYTFKPRVTYKNLIFSPATWIVRKDEIKDLIKNNNDDLINEVDKWRRKRNLPNRVLLEEGDNALFVDLNNLLSVKTLLSSVNKKDTFTLKEFLFNHDNAVVKSEEGIFTNEFIFGFHRKEIQKDEQEST